MPSKNKRGYFGVYTVATVTGVNKFRALITTAERQISLGVYAKSIDAAKAYDLGAMALRGESYQKSKLNFPNLIGTISCKDITMAMSRNTHMPFNQLLDDLNLIRQGIAQPNLKRARLAVDGGVDMKIKVNKESSKRKKVRDRK